MPIPRIIHQVYGTFEDGVDLNNIPIYAQQVCNTRQFCKTEQIKHIMWDSKACRDLLDKYPQYIDLYNNFREPVMRADFIRYLILFDIGGIYVDCDIAPIQSIDHLFEKDEFFVKWNDDKKELPYNAVLGSVKNSTLYAEIIEHLVTSYQEKSTMDIYKKWKGRFVFQTTGHYMLQRVLKNYPKVERLDVLKINNKKGEVIQGDNALFEDYNVSYWFNN